MPQTGWGHRGVVPQGCGATCTGVWGHMGVGKQGNNDNASTLITLPVVRDTAATMPVVGADLSRAVGSLKKTKVSVSLDIANGLKHINEVVNVPNAKGPMDRSLVADGCSRSLCPVVSVCESKQLGFEIDQGAIGAGFLSGSQTYTSSLIEKVISLLLL